MTLRLWFKLFITNVLILFLTICLIFLILIEGLKVIPWNIFFEKIIFNINLGVFLLSFIFVISAFTSFIYSIGLSEPYENIHAKINWLILGKYQHPSFTMEKITPNWYEPYTVVDHDILQLRDKIVQISSDLQEFSAAPTFIGSETKEEIIEQERQRIARELHDSVSQQLFASMMMLSAINETSAKDMPMNTQKQLTKVEEIINNAQTEMRALLLHLRPVELADKSLRQGISQLLEELKPKIPQDVHWELDEIRMDSGIEDHLFRIVQEAISNTLRHAKASKFEVFLHEVDNNVQLKIIDDGKGFNITGNQKVGSYGLINMKERITSLGGIIRISSLPNQGTVIDIKIPLNRK